MTSQPTFIGKYEIVRRLGRGAMGTVYLGRDRDLDRPVAIKVLRAAFLDDETLQRFLREARAAANLRHENIITVYDVGQHDSQPFMAMEYVDGTSLAELIGQRQPLSLAVKLSYIEQLCAGLHHAHREGIVHRDVKPANIMVDRHGVIRILDFGIARVEGSGMTSDGALIGTLGYMSPEQMLGRPVDYRADIFAVGTVAYELLSYRQAFPGTLNDGLLHRLPHEEPPPLSGLPDELAALVGRALAKRPEDRFRDLEEARDAFQGVRQRLGPEREPGTMVVPRHVTETGGPGSSAGSMEPVPDAQRRTGMALAVVAALVAIAAVTAVATWLLIRDTEPRSEQAEQPRTNEGADLSRLDPPAPISPPSGPLEPAGVPGDIGQPPAVRVQDTAITLPAAKPEPPAARRNTPSPGTAPRSPEGVEPLADQGRPATPVVTAFNIVNRSGRGIDFLYIARTDDAGWSDNRLPRTLQAGARFSISLPRDGGCLYDVRVVYDDRSSQEQHDLNVCERPDVSFDGAR